MTPPPPERLSEDPNFSHSPRQTGELIPDTDASAGRATDPDLGNRTALDSPDARHETTDQKVGVRVPPGHDSSGPSFSLGLFWPYQWEAGEALRHLSWFVTGSVAHS